VARRGGLHVVRANYYSPIPDTDTVPASTWTDPAPMPGLALDLDAQLGWLRDDLGPFLDEFRPPRDPPGNADGYFLDNSMYGPVDAALLHAIVRWAKPSRILEVGAGFSTLVASGAAQLNAADGSPVDHRVVDPYPSPVLARLGDRVGVRPLGATEIPAEDFAALGSGDVLFIDTTHTLRPANDVLFLLLEAVPALAPGVIVHVHDVFRPYEYPRELLDTFGAYWQEHWLLQALLVQNDRFEVLAANHALFRDRLPALRALVPSLEGVDHAPSGFWFRRTRVPA
jgi:predicted O-methyltransferase YrrM